MIRPRAKLDGDHLRVPPRPTIIVAIDAYSRAIVGMSVAMPGT